jgi:hypothetical protein
MEKNMEKNIEVVKVGGIWYFPQKGFCSMDPGIGAARHTPRVCPACKKIDAPDTRIGHIENGVCAACTPDFNAA